MRGIAGELEVGGVRDDGVERIRRRWGREERGLVRGGLVRENEVFGVHRELRAVSCSAKNVSAEREVLAEQWKHCRVVLVQVNLQVARRAKLRDALTDCGGEDARASAGVEKPKVARDARF
jgi:hypothetical protein